MEVTPDLGAGMLVINMPQAYLEYTSDDWVPAAMWDEGILCLLADYNVNARARHNEQGGDSNTVSGNGTFGANLGAWRARADWQTNYDQNSDENNSGQKQWTRAACIFIARSNPLKPS